MTVSRLHKIAVLNRSSVFTDLEVENMAKAVAKQVQRDFSPVWGIGAHVYFVPQNDVTSWKGMWNIVVTDTSDEAGALGYHDLTPEGLPLGKVFAKTTLAYGGLVSVTLSHELLEMLGDPDINLCAEAPDGTVYAYENCDAVEADELGYEIDGVRVSDFVTPAWFSGDAPGPFSFRHRVQAPFQLAPGGYISIRVRDSWSQLYADEAARTNPAARANVGTRRERRRTRFAWCRSLP